VYKITVKAVDAQASAVVSSLPNPGSADTYFHVSGATDLSHVYVLPYKHDTYYDMGFRTVFYTDDVDLSSLKPIFTTGEEVDIYSGHSGEAGVKQESGISEVGGWGGRCCDYPYR